MISRPIPRISAAKNSPSPSIKNAERQPDLRDPRHAPGDRLAADTLAGARASSRSSAAECDRSGGAGADIAARARGQRRDAGTQKRQQNNKCNIHAGCDRGGSSGRRLYDKARVQSNAARRLNAAEAVPTAVSPGSARTWRCVRTAPAGSRARRRRSGRGPRRRYCAAGPRRRGIRHRARRAERVVIGDRADRLGAGDDDQGRAARSSATSPLQS